jgi:hypothetical protein
MTDIAATRITWGLMAPHALSDAEFITLTSQVVQACCQAAPVDAANLPALITSVNKALRGRLALRRKKRSVAPSISCSVCTGSHRDAARPQHTLRMAPGQFSRGEAYQGTGDLPSFRDECCAPKRPFEPSRPAERPLN